MLTKEQVLAILKEREAVLEGHFLLTSGPPFRPICPVRKALPVCGYVGDYLQRAGG